MSNFKIGDKFVINKNLTEDECLIYDLEELKKKTLVVEYVCKDGDVRIADGWFFYENWITKVDDNTEEGIVLKDITTKIGGIKITLEDGVNIPKYETELSAGMDVRAWKYSLPSNLKETLDFGEHGFILKPFERVLIKTGIKMSIPENMECQVRSRSGLSLKNGIFVLNGLGTIDADYRGDVGVILANFSNQDFVIKKGDRIAQLVFNEFKRVELNVSTSLDETERGDGGFGHTGI